MMIFQKRCYIKFSEEHGAEIIFIRGDADHNLIHIFLAELHRQDPRFKCNSMLPIIFGLEKRPAWLDSPLGWYVNIEVDYEQWPLLLEMVGNFIGQHGFLQYEVCDPKIMGKP